MRGLSTLPLRARLRRAGDDAFIVALGALAFGEYSLQAPEHSLAMARRFPTVIALRGDQPVGFAIVQLRGSGDAALQAIAVAETERGRGVGRRLLATAEALAAQRGARCLRLQTAEANAAALELFRKRGFAIERKLPAYYRGVYDAVSMVKQLGFG